MSGGQEEQDSSQKTEEPTYKRLQDAREKGQVAVSREISNWMLLVSASIVLLNFMPQAMLDLTSVMHNLLQSPHMYHLDVATMEQFGASILSALLSALGLSFAVLVVVAVLSGVIQNGIAFSPKVLNPDISKISPLTGFRRIFSIRNLLEFLKGLIKIAMVAVVGILVVYPLLANLEAWVGETPRALLNILDSILNDALLAMLSVFLVIALVDLVYKGYRTQQKLMMTKQEVREEFKNTEGGSAH